MIWIKLRREIAATKWQFLTVVLIVTLGISMFSASYMSFRNLKGSYVYSYEKLNFADYWVSLPGFFPAEEISGNVKKVGDGESEARIIVSLPAEVMSSTKKKSFVFGMDLGFLQKYLHGSDEGPATRVPRKLEVRLLSVRDQGRPRVNDLLVVKGAYAGSGDEIMLESRLAAYHDLRPGDWLTLYSPGGISKDFRVAGIVRSPEFIWVARSRQDIIPSPDVFGVAFMRESALRGLMTIEGPALANEVVFNASDPEAASEVLAALPEGSTMISRGEQLSNELLQMDLDGYREMAVFFPAIFLFVGALTLYMLLGRTVHAQRRIIGTMRALGFSGGTIMVHYLAYGLLAGLIGAVVGALSGYYLSSVVTALYVSLIGIPYIHLVPQHGVIAAGVLLGVITTILGSMLPSRAAISLMPAEAMRERKPVAGRKPWLEKMIPSLEKLSGTLKVGFRDLFRNPRRSLYTIFGVAVSTGLILVSSIMLDSADQALRQQFEKIEKFDVMASFFPGIAPDTAREFAGKDGVKLVEGILELPVELQFDSGVYSTVLRGLEPGGQLFDLHPAGVDDADLASTSGNGGLKGVFLGSALRDKYKVSPGDKVMIKSMLTGAKKKLDVLGFADVPMGAMAYGERDAVAFSFSLPNLYTSLFFSLEGDRGALIDRLHAFNGLVYLLDQAGLRETMRQMLKMFYAFLGVMLVFGGLMALAIIFNTTLINILERERELATMRTLGVSNRSITFMVSMQNLILGSVGLLFGGGFGYALAVLAMKMWESDLFSLAVVAYPRTYVATGSTIILVLLLSQVPALRHVGRMDLAEAVKQFEG